MARSYRFRRMLVLERRARRARVEVLRQEVRTWAFWRDFVDRYVLPVAFLLFVGWSMGFVYGVSYIVKEIDAQYSCVLKDHHGD